MLMTIAFNGLTSLQSLLLLEPRLGIIGANDDVETQGKKTAIWTMVLVPCLGVSVMVGIIAFFPKVSSKFGLLGSARIGALLLGGAMAAMPYVTER